VLLFGAVETSGVEIHEGAREIGIIETIIHRSTIEGHHLLFGFVTSVAVHQTDTVVRVTVVSRLRVIAPGKRFARHAFRNGLVDVFVT
jgi:hypothetical protein